MGNKQSLKVPRIPYEPSAVKNGMKHIVSGPSKESSGSQAVTKGPYHTKLYTGLKDLVDEHICQSIYVFVCGFLLKGPFI